MSLSFRSVLFTYVNSLQTDKIGQNGTEFSDIWDGIPQTVWTGKSDMAGMSDLS
jgi:hypothetical protein